MTTLPFVLLALAAIPVVLMLTTAGCGLGPLGTPVTDAPPAQQNPGQPVPGSPVLTPTPGTPLAPAPYSDLVLGSNGLIGYWRLGEPNAILAAPNPKAVNSYTPNALDGNYVSTLGTTPQQTIALQHDGALLPRDADKATSFAGAGGYVDVPYSPLLSPALSLTVELWMQMGTASTDWRVLVGCYEPQPFIDTTIVGGYLVRARTDVKADGSAAIQVEALLGGMAAALNREIPIAKPSWHQIALVYDAAVKEAQLFIDGAGPVDKSQGSYNISAGTGRSLRFAADQRLLVSTYHGLLDEIALYGDNLTAGSLHDHFVAATT